MQVAREDQRNGEQRQEAGEDRTLLALRRVDCRHEAEAELVCDDRARRLERAHQHAPGETDDEADGEFARQDAEQGRQCHLDAIVGR